MTSEDEKARLQLAFDESVRSLEQQQSALEHVRTRAGVVLSAAAVTSSLFGSQVVGAGSLTWRSWAAIALFVLCAVSAVAVLWPRKGWIFSNNVRTLHSVWIDDASSTQGSMLREVADYNQQNRDANQGKLDKLYAWLQAAAMFLAAEVVVWLIDLGAR